MRRQVSLTQLAVVSMFTLVVGCLMGFLASLAFMSIQPRFGGRIAEAEQPASTPSPIVLQQVIATHTPSGAATKPKEIVPSSTPVLDNSPTPTVLPETLSATPTSAASPTVPLSTPTMTSDPGSNLTATLPPLPKAVTATPVPRAAVTVTVTEEQATQQAREEATLAGPGELTIQDPVVDITEQYIELTGKILNLGFASGSDLRLVGVPLVEDGKLRFKVIDATIGSLPVPEEQFPQIEQAVDKVFERILFGYDAQSVAMQDGLIGVQAIPWR